MSSNPVVWNTRESLKRSNKGVKSQKTWNSGFRIFSQFYASKGNFDFRIFSNFMWFHIHFLIFIVFLAILGNLDFRIFPILCNRWPYRAIHGHSWPCMAMHGHPWPFMAIHGHAWPFIAMHGTTAYGGLVTCVCSCAEYRRSLAELRNRPMKRVHRNRFLRPGHAWTCARNPMQFWCIGSSHDGICVLDHWTTCHSTSVSLPRFWPDGMSVANEVGRMQFSSLRKPKYTNCLGPTRQRTSC